MATPASNLSFSLFESLPGVIADREAAIAGRVAGATDMTTAELVALQHDIALWSLMLNEVSTVMSQFRSALQNVLQNVGR